MSDRVDEIVSQWRRERPDVNTAALALLGRLFLVAHHADAELEPAFRDQGLQRGWFDLLAALRRAGPPYELNPTELMRATLVSSGGMTKRLDRLEEAGLVERSPDPGDRRGTRVRLTRTGQAAVDKMLDIHVANEERLLRALSKADRRKLDDLLRALLFDLEQASADATPGMHAGSEAPTRRVQRSSRR
jgi:DNA-binding MarR family transcriptional regulator